MSGGGDFNAADTTFAVNDRIYLGNGNLIGIISEIPTTNTIKFKDQLIYFYLKMIYYIREIKYNSI